MAEKFDFNYSFVENEEQILAEWERENYFGRLKEKNANGKKYKFIDGPITANNPMGIHHAWGRTLKDTFLRFKAMQGYQSHYRNGFDGQGLWVEVEVEKDLGFKTKKDIEEYGLDKFSDKCIERVKKFSGIITEQSKRLGQWMDWDNSYYTYKDNNITAIWQVLKICHENGWLKQIYKPMPWCPRCGTSLSEHEMSGSYKEVEHIAVFIKLPLVGEDADMLVWTTTPWTLTSNVALAVNPQLDYVKVKLDGEARPLIMGKTYFNTKFAGKAQILDSFKGEALAGREFETCFPELELQKDIEHKVVMWDEVLDDEGCGVVHIAPGCGAEDYELGLREKLAVIIPIDEYGIFLKEAGFLAGKDAKLARDEIFEELKKRKKLFYTHPFKHSYPVCWRCKTEILFRCVKEWAIDVEELRPRLIANASKVKWNPPYQGKRMLDWLNNMSDWNISRKRFYGLPLPFYVCEECGELTVVGSREELRELAVDASLVDALPHIHRPWIDKVEIKCPKCKAHVSRVPEVGDVWLDAGIVPFSTLKYFEDREYWKSYFPAEYVVEMKEQIRLWFYSMLFMSTVLIDEPPYLEVGTHGMVAAEDGSRFSKTGFMIKFDEAADKIGADASRYLFASSSMSTDVRFGFNLGDAAKRKLLGYWNLSTFFVTYAEVDHPTVDTSKLEVAALAPIDKWLVTTVNSFIESATEAMNEYTTKNVVTVFEKAIDDISNFYIRVNRRRFWKVENNADKQTAYTVLLYAIKKITQVMAPIIPFMTEYVWKNVIARYEDGIEDSVHLSDWPTVLSGVDTKDAIIAQVDYARSVISLVLKLRSEKQIRIRQPLATLYICSGEKAPAIEQVLLDVIKSEVNVKAVKIIDDRSILEDYVAALDFKQAGSVLKADVNKVKELLAAQSDADMQRTVDEIRLGGDVAVTGFDRALPARIFLLCAVPKKHITLEQEGDLLVALDTIVTPELMDEGRLRDMLRQCQVMRKTAEFNVDDRIVVYIETKSSLEKVIGENGEYVESELLATISKEPLEKPEISESFEVDGVDVKVMMRRA